MALLLVTAAAQQPSTPRPAAQPPAIASGATFTSSANLVIVDVKAKDKNGAVIGVATATYEAGQNLNFAIPASELIELLSRTGPLVPLAKTE